MPPAGLFASAILVSLAALYYAWFIIRAYRGLSSLPAPPEQAPPRSVTVLIPARNEESTVGPCLEALLSQDYQRDLLEIIVIDDGSSDATADIVRAYRRRDERVTLLQLGADTADRPSKKRGRKAEAISRGIAVSTSDIIVTTDSDCVAPASWVRVLTSSLQGDTVYVVGPVLEERGNSFFTRLRALEVLGLIGISAGRIGLGRPVNGHGGNTAFLREVYHRSGGFDLEAVKSDEETLLHEVLFLDLGRVGFAPSPLARVRTSSPPTFGNYWNQRLRWGSMHGRFRNNAILVELACLYLSLLIPLVALAAGMWIPELVPWALFALALKAIVDLAMVNLAARKFGEAFSLATFIAGELVHGVVILSVSTIAQLLPYRWKDRTVLAVDPSRRA